MLGAEVRVLILLSLLAQPALAARPRTLFVEIVDAEGRAVPAAAVVTDFEDTRHRVNRHDGVWNADVLYGPDGAERPLVKGTRVDGWVVAPGYEPARFSTIVKRRRSRHTVVLQTMDVRPGSVSLPSADEAEGVRRALREAAAALQMRDLRMADARLDAADRGRILLEGAPYVDATLAVHELRTLLALSAWQAREQWITDDPELLDNAQAHALDVSRGVTADLALDWRDYARGAGRSDTRAQALCRMASGRVSRCD